jgi:carbon-monoxide dehydrogenase medium subunit
VHADPAAEYPAIVLALDAELVILKDSGARRVAAHDFFIGPLETVLQPGELLAEIRIPGRQTNEGFGFEEVSRRRGDFALVGVAAKVRVSGARIESAALAICGLEEGAIRVPLAEQALIGMKASPDAVRDAMAIGTNALSAQTDLHATAEYRLHLARVLGHRALRQAIVEASEGQA